MRLSQFLFKKLGFKQINTDHNIFVMTIRINRTIFIIFIDEIKVIGVKRFGHIKQFKLKLVIAFEMIIIGLIGFYLELKIEKNLAKRMLKLL